ncbi:hypothetical protein B0H19DRAFT_276762 [Mycena capillaripes]|nr:hypothetical protein B0H19DRAFT_276762 [Mycena capillaripes]
MAFFLLLPPVFVAFPQRESTLLISSPPTLAPCCTMFSFAVLVLAAASANAHSFSRVRRHHVPRTQPVGWATGYLEVYEVYHERYTAIGCENKHNTTFFDSCCHPLLATETLAKNRPACCAVGATVACPGTAASSTAALVSKPSAPPTKTSAPALASKPSAPAPAKPAKASTAAAPASTADEEECEDEDDGNTDGDNTDDEECEDDEDNGNDDGDDDGEECEDDGEEDASAAATSTKVAATSHTAVVPTSAKNTPTTSSTHTTPTTTSTPPKTTSTAKAVATPEPTTTSTAATSSKTSTGDFITGGFGTWFYQGGNAGACGKVHKDSDFVVALDTKMYAKGINCGRTIRLTNLSNGKTADGLVADECPTCRNGQSVDMSVKMFESLAALSVGEFSVKYEFLN